MSSLSATRATLAALSAGAEMSAALQVGARASPDRVGDALLDACQHADDDAFKRDVLERLPFSPPLVGVILGRAKKQDLPEVASLILEALQLRGARVKLVLDPPAVVATALLVLVISMTLSVFVSPMPILDVGSLIPAQLLAVAGLVMAGFGFAMRRDRPPVATWVRGPLGASDAIRLPPPLTVDRLLLWIAAGDRAGVVPGAVVAGLARARMSGFSRTELGHFEVALRGVSTSRKGAEVILRSTQPALADVAAADYGEPDPTAVHRLARLCRLTPGGRVDVGHFLAYGAMAFVVLSVLWTLVDVYSAISLLGGML